MMNFNLRLRPLLQKTHTKNTFKTKHPEGFWNKLNLRLSAGPREDSGGSTVWTKHAGGLCVESAKEQGKHN